MNKMAEIHTLLLKLLKAFRRKDGFQFKFININDVGL